MVKKGEDEYNIIVSGVKDTGLCGKYWADLDSLPPRRRRTTVEAAKAEEEAARKAAEAESESYDLFYCIVRNFFSNYSVFNCLNFLSLAMDEKRTVFKKL